MLYYSNYLTEPIGGSNPNYRCSYCKISVPQINGELENHQTWCEYRQEKEFELTKQLQKDY